MAAIIADCGIGYFEMRLDTTCMIEVIYAFKILICLREGIGSRREKGGELRLKEWKIVIYHNYLLSTDSLINESFISIYYHIIIQVFLYFYSLTVFY